MLEVHCPDCSARYEIDPRRVPDSGMVMRCPTCSGRFRVNQEGGVAAEAAGGASGQETRAGDQDGSSAVPSLPLALPFEPPPEGGASGPDPADERPTSPAAARQTAQDTERPAAGVASERFGKPDPMTTRAVESSYDLDAPDLDLPAPLPLDDRFPELPDLPALAPSEQPGTVDLPGLPRSPEATPPKMNFSRPSEDGLGGLPKDSLALDPSPFDPQTAAPEPFIEAMSEASSVGPLPEEPTAVTTDPPPGIEPMADDEITDLPAHAGMGPGHGGALELPPIPDMDPIDLDAPDLPTPVPMPDPGTAPVTSASTMPDPSFGDLELPSASSLPPALLSPDLSTPRDLDELRTVARDLPSDSMPPLFQDNRGDDLHSSSRPPASVPPTLSSVTGSEGGPGAFDEEASFADLGLPSGEMPQPTSGGSKPAPVGENFGEIELGGQTPGEISTEGAMDPTPVPLSDSRRPPNRARQSRTRPPSQQTPRRSPWPTAIALIILLFATGLGLGLTRYGLFGFYFFEQLRPEAGSPAQTAQVVKNAENQALPDTYPAVRESLQTLSVARQATGLNLDLLVRSLLHESLYQLRFGGDSESGRSAVAILARVQKRAPDHPGLNMARAADLGRRGQVSEALRLAGTSPATADPIANLVRGELLLLANKVAQASSAFQQALDMGAGARGHWGMARALQRAGKTAEAIAAAQATLSLSPSHSDATVMLARHNLDLGKLETALDQANMVALQKTVDGARLRPTKRASAMAWQVVGQVEERLGHLHKARDAFGHALSRDSTSLSALLGSGRALQSLQHWREALARFQSARDVAENTKVPELRQRALLEASLGASQIMIKLERAKEAFDLLRSREAQHREDAQLQLWLGNACRALDRREQAEAYFRRSIERAPDRFEGYLALSNLLVAMQRTEEAAEVADLAKQHVVDGVDMQRMLGESALQRGRLRRAAAYFQKALQFESTDHESLFGLAKALRRRGELTSAEDALDRLQRVAPDFPGRRLERGLIHEMRGDYEAAARLYGEALESRPDDADLLLRMGAAQVTLGKLEAAEELLRKVIDERSGSAEAEYFMGRLRFARQQTSGAINHFQRAVQLDPTRAEYHMYLAWAALEVNDLGSALQSIDRALTRDENLADGHWVRGRILLRTGEVVDALSHFKRTLSLSPGRSEAYAGMAEALEQLRQLAPAIQAYETAVERMPAKGKWWYRLGQLQLDNGARDAATRSLSRAVKLGDRRQDRPLWVAEAHRIYADSLMKQGRRTRALDHYEAYLDRAPRDAIDRAEVTQILQAEQR